MEIGGNTRGGDLGRLPERREGLLVALTVVVVEVREKIPHRYIQR